MTYRLTRMTAPAGTVLALDDAPLFRLVDVYEGVLERTVSGSERTPPFWNTIHGGYLPVVPDWSFELAVAGDGPAVISEMAVLQAAPAGSDEQ